MSNGSTPVPNVLIDNHLRNLKSAEIKVLLIVIRKASAQMQCDWISGTQLSIQTGSSRRAISSAIEMLIRKGLIEVTDRQGNILREPIRRKGKTNLFFRLSPFLFKANITELKSLLI